MSKAYYIESINTWVLVITAMVDSKLKKSIKEDFISSNDLNGASVVIVQGEFVYKANSIDTGDHE
ncbi:hypothetical protein [Lactiplantibacillus plantarum]|uniref:hypothetical protein n=1 Tax=Lactiplantibacillus plantarum TaxID=1590 RepID=UPI002240CE65|nr:hypothetical protein [Lactiplantibacillus plantarum]